MVFSTWVRGLSKLKCINPTTSHSFWKWSWLCSWWGSVRVEVILKFLKKIVIFFFNQTRWGLRITPGLTFLSALLVLFFMYDPPRWDVFLSLSQIGHSSSALNANDQLFMQKGWKWRKRGDGPWAHLLVARSQIHFLRQKFCPQRRGWAPDFWNSSLDYSRFAGFTCVTFTTGALAYFAPVYFETGIESLGEGCPGYDENFEPFDKDSVNFVIGAITAAAGGNSLFCSCWNSLHPSRSWWSSVRDAAFLLPQAKVWMDRPFHLWRKPSHQVTQQWIIFSWEIFFKLYLSHQHSFACCGCPACERKHHGRLRCDVLWNVFPQHKLVSWLLTWWNSEMFTETP